MDDRFKEELSEHVFCSKNVEGLDEQINLFFDELKKRKRDDEEEEGLQAAAVIYPDGFAAKVCENDGKGTHQNSFINLTKFLNGDKRYLSEDGTGFFNLYMDIVKQLQDSIEVRILSKEEELKLSVTASKPMSSEFQLETLKKLIVKSNELKKNGSFKIVTIGVATKEIYFEHTDVNDEMLQNISGKKVSSL